MTLRTAALAVCGIPAFAAMISAQAEPAQPAPAIRATSTEVLLDVVVRDKHQKLANNLKASDVEIYEDGVRQQITGFRFVGAREAQALRSGTVSGGAKLPVPPRSRALRSVNLVPIVFYNLDPVSRNRALDAVRQFLQGDMPPDTYVGLFLLDDHLAPVHPFTNNRSEIIRALPNVFTAAPLDFSSASVSVLTANPTSATLAAAVDAVSHAATVNLRVAGGEVAQTAIAGADVSTSPSANIVRGAKVTEQRDLSNITGMHETDKIITMIDRLGELPGRKTVLLLTTGLTTTGDPDRFQSILDKANDAGMTIYPVSATGLDETSTAAAAGIALNQVASVSRTQTGPSATGQGALAAAKEKSRMGDTMDNAVRTSDIQSSLRALAEGTGGFLIANTNDFRKSFQQVTDDFDAHYEASYRPVSDKWDGRLRRIEVKIARPGMTAESRNGYFAMPDLGGQSGLAPFESIGLTLLNANPPAHTFEFSVATFHFRPGTGTNQEALVFELPGTSLAAAPIAEQETHMVHVSLVALVKDARGEVVDKFAVDAPYEIPDANLGAVRASPLVYSHLANLLPGPYTVETVVMDRESGRASAAITKFESPALPKGLALSSAAVIQRIEPAAGQPAIDDPLVLRSSRLLPSASGRLPAGAKPYAYFVVYPDKSNAEKAKVQVEFRTGGQTAANQTSDLPAPDASGAIPMVIRAATHEGDCELKITVTQGAESATQTIAYTVLP